jgi:hypothetical protein
LRKSWEGSLLSRRARIEEDKVANRPLPKKSAPLSVRRKTLGVAWLKESEINALMSP